MRKLLRFAALILMALAIGSCNLGNRGFQTFNPGNTVEIGQDLTINIVFIGYEQGSSARQINLDEFKKILPSKYSSVNRIPTVYYLDYKNGEKELSGNSFTYNYNIKLASQGFEDAFFARLNELAQPKPLTLYQESYNCQVDLGQPGASCPGDAANISKKITENYWIDAFETEKWLAENASQLGIDPKNYTVFFINWYGRSDFKHHVYVKTDEPDPDTGFNFGQLLHSRKMSAWGGSTPDDLQGSGASLSKTARVWFYDLSAGPEAQSDNWDITNADLDGDGKTDYRIPPIWEYGSTKTTYRPFNNLSGDLGRITRYVAINLLFTPSPIYRVAITSHQMPDDLLLNVNFYNDPAAGDQGQTLFDSSLATALLKKLQPLNNFTATVRELSYDSRAQCSFESYFTGAPCYPEYALSVQNPGSGADVFIDNLLEMKQPGFFQGGADYEIPIFAYNVAGDIPYLGLADDDWRSGTQSLIYAADNPVAKTRYGYTTTITHEVGHHTALSHPHDGYDSSENKDYGPSNEFYYAWLGDMSNSVMSYIDLTAEFGQFNRDAMNRYLVAAYLNQGNAVLQAMIDAKKLNVSTIPPSLRDADSQMAEALKSYRALEYEAAVQKAKGAYDAVVAEALKEGVNIRSYWFEGYALEPALAGSTSALRVASGLKNADFPINESRVLERRMRP